MPRRKVKYKVATANTSKVAEFAETLSDEFIQCRELGHLWRPLSAAVADGCYERVLRCPRCRTRREETISMRGEVLRRHMVYPDGYVAKHIGRIVGDGRGQLRLSSLERTVAHTDELATRRAARRAV